ncbi:MAG: hypothetical protein R3B99_05090 [Polyangiales bacterium]
MPSWFASPTASEAPKPSQVASVPVGHASVVVVRSSLASPLVQPSASLPSPASLTRSIRTPSAVPTKSSAIPSALVSPRVMPKPSSSGPKGERTRTPSRHASARTVSAGAPPISGSVKRPIA